ncbi:MAG: acyltransferase [Sandaracinaceae bacterium]|nr:acyltransferase [Sandaracinaceae bacterium]
MTESESKAAPAQEPRFLLIDALRAFAALWVVAHHWYYRNLVAEGATPFIEPFHAVFREGWLGVSVFFVLSGFVITHSIRGATITPAYLGRFALRRSLRLDPPYWVAIVATIVLNIVSSSITHERLAPTPGAAEIAAHVLYVQHFFGIKDIVGVFWTLCYEIQFYLLLVIATGLAARFGRLAVFGSLWLFAMACGLGWIPLSSAFSFAQWPLFFLGVLTYWSCIERSLSLPLAAGIALATFLPLISIGDHHTVLRTSVALATALLIAAGALKHFLGTLSLGRVMQFLGKISYSIYLLHMVVGTRAVHLVMRHYGYHLNVRQSMLAIVIGLVVTITGSYLNYRLIEKPAQNLSRRISMDTSRPMWQPVRKFEAKSDMNAA